MKKYFYTDGYNQFGPFTLDELKEKNISQETKVWFEVLSEWTEAKNITEIKILFDVPLPKQQSSPSQPTSPMQASQTTTTNPYQSIRTMPKNWLVESIIVSILSLCCGFFGIIP